MTRLHLHVVVQNLSDAIRFYSAVFATKPCCGGPNYANWRIDQPALDLAASVANRPAGLAHFGLEVENPGELSAIDRVLHSSATGTVRWEVSVRKQPVRKEFGS